LLFFNVSGVSDDEEILSAELHLYRHRQRVKSSFKGSAMKPVIYMVMAHWKASISRSIQPKLWLTNFLVQQVQIYQVTDLQWISHPEKNRLLVTTYVDVAVSNWEIFHIRPAVVSEWISGRSPNLGLVIVVTSLQGHPADHHFFSHDPHTSKQPILVLFSTSKAADSTPSGQFDHSIGFWVECRPSGRNPV
jgi:TGF-beta propeptide